MATVANSTSYLQDEENKKKNAGTSGRSIRGSYNDSGSISGTANSGGISGAQSKPSSSGAFTNFQQYADLNKDQSGNYAKNVSDVYNQGTDDLVGGVTSKVGQIGAQGITDYSGLVGDIQKGTQEAVNYGNASKDFNTRTNIVPSKTKGQGILNNFLLGTNEAQQAFDENLYGEEDITGKIKGAAKTRSGEFIGTLNDPYEAAVEKYASGQEKFNTDMQKKYDDWIQKLYAYRDEQSKNDENYKTEGRRGIERNETNEQIQKFKDLYADTYYNFDKTSSINQKEADILAWMSENPEYSGYSYNPAEDITTEQQAALDALTEISGEDYSLENMDYGINGIGVGELGETRFNDRFKIDPSRVVNSNFRENTRQYS